MIPFSVDLPPPKTGTGAVCIRAHVAKAPIVDVPAFSARSGCGDVSALVRVPGCRTSVLVDASPARRVRRAFGHGVSGPAEEAVLDVEHLHAAEP